MSEPTPEAIEAAAKAIWDTDRLIGDRKYEDVTESTKEQLRDEARAALSAAAPYLIREAQAQALTEAQDEWQNACRLAPLFWSRVAIREPAVCWPFQGATLQFGHGSFKSPAGRVAHRYAWALQAARLPTSEEVVRHICDNPICCNPGHLIIGSQADNVDDMISRGRAGFKKDHCRNGHPLTADNVILRKSGERRCRSCCRRQERERRKAAPRVECPECQKDLSLPNLNRHKKAVHGARAAAIRDGGQ
jgi:hypothetical protein